VDQSLRQLAGTSEPHQSSSLHCLSLHFSAFGC
jgi:hypothetical protein